MSRWFFSTNHKDIGTLFKKYIRVVFIFIISLMLLGQINLLINNYKSLSYILIFILVFRIILFTIILICFIFKIDKKNYMKNLYIVKKISKFTLSISNDFYILYDLYPNEIKKRKIFFNGLKVILEITLCLNLLLSFFFFNLSLESNFIFKINIILISFVWIYEGFLQYKYISNKLYTYLPWWTYFTPTYWLPSSITTNESIKILDQKLDKVIKDTQLQSVLVDKVNRTTMDTADTVNKFQQILVGNKNPLGLENPRIIRIVTYITATGRITMGILMCSAGLCWIQGEFFEGITLCKYVGSKIQQTTGLPPIYGDEILRPREGVDNVVKIEPPEVKE